MARGEYFVSSDADRWKVEHNGTSITFGTPRAALGAAVQAAQTAGQRGYGGTVLVRGPDGGWRVEWR